jgi:hypothetical protein
MDMLLCVRTTLNLPDALAEEAKERAAAEGRTFTSLVEEGLRMVLERTPEASTREPLPTFRGGGFLIDLEDKEALWEILDADGFK